MTGWRHARFLSRGWLLALLALFLVPMSAMAFGPTSFPLRVLDNNDQPVNNAKVIIQERGNWGSYSYAYTDAQGWATPSLYLNNPPADKDNMLPNVGLYIQADPTDVAHQTYGFVTGELKGWNPFPTDPVIVNLDAPPTFKILPGVAVQFEIRDEITNEFVADYGRSIQVTDPKGFFPSWLIPQPVFNGASGTIYLPVGAAGDFQAYGDGNYGNTASPKWYEEGFANFPPVPAEGATIVAKLQRRDKGFFTGTVNGAGSFSLDLWPYLPNSEPNDYWGRIATYVNTNVFGMWLPPGTYTAVLKNPAKAWHFETGISIVPTLTFTRDMTMVDGHQVKAIIKTSDNKAPQNYNNFSVRRELVPGHFTDLGTLTNDNAGNYFFAHNQEAAQHRLSVYSSWQMGWIDNAVSPPLSYFNPKDETFQFFMVDGTAPVPSYTMQLAAAIAGKCQLVNGTPLNKYPVFSTLRDQNLNLWPGFISGSPYYNYTDGTFFVPFLVPGTALIARMDHEALFPGEPASMPVIYQHYVMPGAFGALEAGTKVISSSALTLDLANFVMVKGSVRIGTDTGALASEGRVFFGPQPLRHNDADITDLPSQFWNLYGQEQGLRGEADPQYSFPVEKGLSYQLTARPGAPIGYYGALPLNGGFIETIATFTVPTDQVSPLNLNIVGPIGGQIVGKVMVNGEPLATGAAKLMVQGYGATPNREGHVAADTNFGYRVTGLTAGTYTMILDNNPPPPPVSSMSLPTPAQDFPQVEPLYLREVVLNSDTEIRNFDFALDSNRIGFLAGRVMDETGAPLPWGAEFSVWKGSREVFRFTTNANASYTRPAAPQYPNFIPLEIGEDYYLSFVKVATSTFKFEPPQLRPFKVIAGRATLLPTVLKRVFTSKGIIKVDGNPLPNAGVEALDMNLGYPVAWGYTDQGGQFEFTSGINPGTYTMVVRKYEYGAQQAFTKVFFQPKADLDQVVDFPTTDLRTLTVSANSNLGNILASAPFNVSLLLNGTPDGFNVPMVYYVQAGPDGRIDLKLPAGVFAVNAQPYFENDPNDWTKSKFYQAPAAVTVDLRAVASAEAKLIWNAPLDFTVSVATPPTGMAIPGRYSAELVDEEFFVATGPTSLDGNMVPNTPHMPVSVRTSEPYMHEPGMNQYVQHSWYTSNEGERFVFRGLPFDLGARKILMIYDNQNGMQLVHFFGPFAIDPKNPHLTVTLQDLVELRVKLADASTGKPLYGNVSVEFTADPGKTAGLPGRYAGWNNIFPDYSQPTGTLTGTPTGTFTGMDTSTMTGTFTGTLTGTFTGTMTPSLRMSVRPSEVVDGWMVFKLPARAYRLICPGAYVDMSGDAMGGAGGFGYLYTSIDDVFARVATTTDFVMKMKRQNALVGQIKYNGEKVSIYAGIELARDGADPFDYMNRFYGFAMNGAYKVFLNPGAYSGYIMPPYMPEMTMPTGTETGVMTGTFTGVDTSVMTGTFTDTGTMTGTTIGSNLRLPPNFVRVLMTATDTVRDFNLNGGVYITGQLMGKLASGTEGLMVDAPMPWMFIQIFRKYENRSIMDDGRPFAPYPAMNSMTDENGNFKIFVEKNVDYYLLPMAPAGFMPPAPVRVVVNEVDVVQNLRVEPATSVDVTGVVTGSTGSVVVQAIQMGNAGFIPGFNQFSTTNQVLSVETEPGSGHFVLTGLIPGVDYKLLFKPNDPTLAWVAYGPVRAGMSDLAIAMEPGYTVRGRLVNDEGQTVGLRGVPVELDLDGMGVQYKVETTTATGAFVFRQVPAQDFAVIKLGIPTTDVLARSYTLNGVEYAVTRSDPFAIGAETPDILINVQAAGKIAGRLVDRTGLPIRQAELYLSLEDIRIEYQGQIATDGGFAFKFLPPFPDYKLQVNVPGKAPFFKSGISVLPGDTTELGAVTIGQAQEFKGVIGNFKNFAQMAMPLGLKTDNGITSELEVLCLDGEKIPSDLDYIANVEKYVRGSVAPKWNNASVPETLPFFGFVGIGRNDMVLSISREYADNLKSMVFFGLRTSIATDVGIIDPPTAWGTLVGSASFVATGVPEIKFNGDDAVVLVYVEPLKHPLARAVARPNNGTWMIEKLPVGTYRVVLAHREYPPVSRIVTVEADKTTAMPDLKVAQRAVKITGQVNGPDGLGLANVAANLNGVLTTLSNASGEYKFFVPPTDGKYIAYLKLSKPGYAAYKTSVEFGGLAPNTDYSLGVATLTTDVAKYFRGYVLDSVTQEPVVGAKVRLAVPGELNAPMKIFGEVQTDGTGLYQFNSVPSGMGLILNIFADGYKPIRQTVAALSNGDEKEFGNVLLEEETLDAFFSEAYIDASGTIKATLNLAKRVAPDRINILIQQGTTTLQHLKSFPDQFEGKAGVVVLIATGNPNLPTDILLNEVGSTEILAQVRIANADEEYTETKVDPFSEDGFRGTLPGGGGIVIPPGMLPPDVGSFSLKQQNATQTTQTIDDGNGGTQQTTIAGPIFDFNFGKSLGSTQNTNSLFTLTVKYSGDKDPAKLEIRWFDQTANGGMGAWSKTGVIDPQWDSPKAGYVTFKTSHLTPFASFESAAKRLRYDFNGDSKITTDDVVFHLAWIQAGKTTDTSLIMTLARELMPTVVGPVTAVPSLVNDDISGEGQATTDDVVLALAWIQAGRSTNTTTINALAKELMSTVTKTIANFPGVQVDR